MRLGKSRVSRNVEDRRGRRMSLGGKGSIGIGTIMLALVAMYFGVDPSVVLQNTGTPTSGHATYDTSTGETRPRARLLHAWPVGTASTLVHARL